MSIMSVTPLLVAYPEPHYRNVERYLTLVRIEDSSGQVGWGECISQFPEATRATKALIDGGLSELLIGQDPMNIEGLWHTMLARCFWYGSEGIAAFAISAIDMALWDLKGHLLGQPVASLLGGHVTDRVPAMASFILDMDDLNWTVEEFAMHKQSGFRILKAGWGMTPDSQFGTDRERDLLLVDRIRAAVGYEVDVILDVAGHRRFWDLPTAIQRFKDLEPYRLRWIEQPLPSHDLAAHAKLRGAVTTPIGTGEDEWNPESYKRLIESEGVDVVQLDPGRCLGITGSRQILKMIEAANLDASAHTWSSALNTAASLHLLANSPNHVGMDLKPHPSPMQHELVTDPWVQIDGCVQLRDVPGLGVTVDEAAVAKYAWR